MKLLLFLFFLLKIECREGLLPDYVKKIDEWPSQTYYDMSAWFRKVGGYITANAIPQTLAQENRYLMTGARIRKKEVILEIPFGLAISIFNNDVQKECKKIFRNLEENQFACIVYYMTVEESNASTKYNFYFSYLPIMSLEKFAISSENEPGNDNLLREVGMDNNVRIFKKKYDDTYRAVSKALEDYAKKEQKSMDDVKKVFTNNFLLVLTRSVNRKGSLFNEDILAMVPMMDLLNHNPDPTVEWHFDDEKNAYIGNCLKNLASHDELSINYGNYPNSYLYTFYGFTVKDNPVSENVHIVIEDKDFTLRMGEAETTIPEIYKRLDYKSKTISHETVKGFIIASIEKKIERLLKLKTKNEILKSIIAEHINICRYYLKEVKHRK